VCKVRKDSNWRAFMPFIASALTSGITSGTPSAMRNADELSTTVHPTSAAIGPNFFEMPPPAEKSATSQSEKLSSFSSSTVYVSPSKS
jgi:hypothetical protein